MSKKGVLLTHLFCQVFNNLINVSSIFTTLKKKPNKKMQKTCMLFPWHFHYPFPGPLNSFLPSLFFLPTSPYPIIILSLKALFYIKSALANLQWWQTLNQTLSILWFIRNSLCLCINSLTKWWLHYGQSEMWVTHATHYQNFWSPLEIPTLSWIHFVLRGCWFKCWMIHCLLLSPAVWA